MAEKSYTLDINIGNYKSIKKAEDIFGKLSKEIDKAIDDALLETGKEIEKHAHKSLSEYGIGSGEVASSLELKTSNESIELIATSDHADFVEFGTGIKGSENPHPKPTGWTYDVNNHGDSGWVYCDANNNFHWTAGTESRPFMYKSWRYGSSIIGSKVTKHLNILMKGAGL